MSAILSRPAELRAPWRLSLPTWNLPRVARWQIAVALWAIPALAIWAQHALGLGTLPLLAKWLAADPMLAPAALLIVATELMSVLVISSQVGSRRLSLRRFLVPPLILAGLPLALGLGQIQDQALFLAKDVPLWSHHVFTLVALLYGSFALLSLRGFLIADPQTRPQPLREAEGLAVAHG